MKKKLIITTILALMLITLSKTTVNANYQSIPTGSALKRRKSTWITEIRQMEKSGQGMGLKETINTTTALATSKSNNIDVHLQKNTEYGAILLLGASDYGKQGSNITARRMDKGSTTTSGTDVKATTTGNVTGIYEMGYCNMDISKYGDAWEWTAGGLSSLLSNIAPRYKNVYTTSTTSAKVGDATTETSKWHGSTNAAWVSSANPGFNRGCTGAFSYRHDNGGGDSTRYARAIAVCGTGF